MRFTSPQILKKKFLYKVYDRVKMKKIGFIDYYIDEWHANNYPVWINDICRAENKQFEVAYAWAELDRMTESSLSTQEWCDKFGVEKCNTIEELCEKSDYIVILAPSDPDKHLGYVEKVFKFGKRTYVDKTFAPDYETAKCIFELGEKYNTFFFSSSALRYAEELEGKKCETIITMNGGGNYEEYIIHQIEMVVKTMGIGISKARVIKSGEQYFTTLEYVDGRQANMIFAKFITSGAYMKTSDFEGFIEFKSDFFANLLKDILNFFETGEKSFDGKETLEVMKVREGVIKGMAKCGEWIEL